MTLFGNSGLSAGLLVYEWVLTRLFASFASLATAILNVSPSLQPMYGGYKTRKVISSLSTEYVVWFLLLFVKNAAANSCACIG
jgi:hypothetical protein